MQPEPASSDIDVGTMVLITKQLDANPPVTTCYERDRPQVVGAWWACQREHLIYWFAQQSTLGTADFPRKAPNASGRKTYNNLRSAAAILFLAEGLGASRWLVQAAADAARAESNSGKACKMLREKFFPWSLIYSLIKPYLSKLN